MPKRQRAAAVQNPPAPAEKHLGENHPETAFRLNNLATLLYAKDRREEAEPMMARAWRIFEPEKWDENRG